MEHHIFRKDGIGHCCFCAECIATQGEKHGSYTGVPHTVLIVRFCRIVVRDDRLEELAYLLRFLQDRIMKLGETQLREALCNIGIIQHVVGGNMIWRNSFQHMLEHIFIVDEHRDFNDEYLKVGITFVFPASVNVKDVVAWFQYQLKKRQSILIPDAAMSLRRYLSPKTGAAQPHPWWMAADAAQPNGL